MTDRLTPLQKKLVAESATAPIGTAHIAAAGVVAQLGPEGVDPALWPALGEGEPADMAAHVVGVLAPFTRDNPGVPAEALYLHAGGAGVLPAGAPEWAILAPHWRLAYSTFQNVLGAVDIEVQRQVALMPPAPAPKRKGKVDVEGTALETIGGFLDRVDFGPAPVKGKAKAS